jgi:hypothetical protein
MKGTGVPMCLPQAQVTPTIDVYAGVRVEPAPQARLPVEKATRPEVELPAKDTSIFLQKLSNSASVLHLKLSHLSQAQGLNLNQSLLFFPSHHGICH